MTRASRAFERFLTGWMDTCSQWMNANNLLLRALGLLIGIAGIFVIWVVLVVWAIFGKKPV